jgi:NDP-sugar pyrophosphorylase family protein
MHGVILAAGKGTRLRPLTLSRSKAMAPILGKPIVARILDEFIFAGITNVTFVVSPHDKELVDYFEKHYSNKVSLHFAEQKERLGMAHALNCARKTTQDHFVLSACDSLVSPKHIKSLVELFEKENPKGILTLMEVSEERISKTGIVDFDEKGKIKRIVEKPKPEDAPTNISSLPIYAFDKVIFEYLDKVPKSERGEYELQDAIQMLIDNFGSLSGLKVDYRLDLTNPDDLLDINLKHLREELEENHILSDIPESTTVESPVYIEKNVSIGRNCKVGPNVYIESESVIEDNCEIADSIILKGSKVKTRSKIAREALM